MPSRGPPIGKKRRASRRSATSRRFAEELKPAECPECGEAVSPRARHCPHCDTVLMPVAKKKKRGLLGKLFVLVLFVILLAGAAFVALIALDRFAPDVLEFIPKELRARLEAYGILK